MVELSGAVILTGNVVWDSCVINGSPVLTDDKKLIGMAPVPVPPPNTGDPCPCIPPSGAPHVENQMTPGSHSIKDAGTFITMGAMYMQKDGSGGKTCQPMMAQSAQTPINNTPVVTENDIMMFVGFLNGAGASQVAPG